MSLTPRPILEAAALSKVFKGPSSLFSKPKIVQAVDRVSLRVWHGETLAIVGESGSGSQPWVACYCSCSAPPTVTCFMKAKT